MDPAEAPWREVNTKLRKEVPGVLSKTWISGLHNKTIGGLYAFDTLENAKQFAVHTFPAEPAAMKAAFYTRIFDAKVVEKASKPLSSPFFK